mmetsp:Transcript_26326/g.30444  ORF Transcript_26326/g.30444 Transcript_26326/m.30444 type:complete len:170 (-) Transcript_26326:32-541(-)
MEKAYKNLMDNDKRHIYQRIIREAKERVEYEREKENKKRAKEGKELLPQDTFNIDVQTMCQKLFDQIEENKEYYERVEQIRRKRMHKDIERRKIAKEIEKEDERAWEENRDKRVKKWRKFIHAKTGTRNKQGFEFKSPKFRTEVRPASAPKSEETKPMGIDDSYKKQWK